ncbi:caspase family protein [Porticoccaceae bacterium]|nr:caspase family protein [Porticoccaceae bacterium]
MMITSARFFLLSLAFLSLFSAKDVCAERLALVIGNDKYQSIPALLKAGEDAKSMGQVLKNAGFRVTSLQNATYREIVKSVDKFSREIKPDDQAVFFFAGHGVQLKSGNYILPVDVDAENESMVERTSYSLDDITFLLGRHKSGFQLIIVDACRDNPFPTKTRSFGNTRGLIPVEPVKGQMVMYSASRGQQALDRLGPNDRDKNGVFTRKLISKLSQKGLSALQVIRDVQDEVEELAATVNHDQRPAVYNESRGDFYFFGPPKNTGASQINPDLSFWQDVKAIGNLEAFDAYLTTYPKGRYVSLARAYASKLRAAITPNTNAERNALKNEMEFWDEVKKRNTIASFSEYVNLYPSGFFVSVADDYLQLLDSEIAIATIEKYASSEDMVSIERDKKVFAASKKRIENEDRARMALAKKLSRLDIPTF